MNDETVRVFIADDHTLFRDGLRALFSSVPDIEVVGEAASGEEIVERVRVVQPDVILMDVQMPHVNGIEATRQITRGNPDTSVIVVTMLDDDDSVFAAMRAGARGYVLKGADQAEMLRAIRAAAQGEALFSPGIADKLQKFLSKPRFSEEEIFPELTAREREVLDLLAAGHNKHEIAKSLGISPKTVSNHLSNIYSKLQVADRAEAMLRAREAGLGKD
jgi:DNA-binding NarL/FixJ family response regulator